jgi:hypothetical protein
MDESTLPLTRALTVYPGSCFQARFRWRPDGTTPADFAGYRASFLLGTSGDPLVWNTTGISDLAAGASHDDYPFCPTPSGVFLLADGVIVLHLSDQQTADLPGPVARYTLDLVPPDGMSARFLRGEVQSVADLRRVTT